MYQNVYISKKNEQLCLWDDELGFKLLPLKPFLYAYKIKAGGKYKSIYNDDLEKVYKFNNEDSEIFEGDINLSTRVLIDLYKDSDEISKINTVIIDIEVEVIDSFPDIDVAKQKITAISLYDFTTDKYYCLILDEKNNIKNFNLNSNVNIINFKYEDELLIRFLEIWEIISPNVVSSWNGFYFDMPYLFNRITNVLGKKFGLKMSPIGICYFNSYEKSIIIAGISQLDYMDLYKKFIGKLKPSYSLDSVCKEELNEGKIKFEGSFSDLYNTNIDKFIKYNLNDVELIVKLDKKFKYIDLTRSIAHIGHVVYEDIYYTTRYIEGAILTYLKRHGNLISPNKSKEGRLEYEQMIKDGEEGFEGAFVKEAVGGLYEYVKNFDVNSLYPSLIRTLNISPETKYGKILNWEELKLKI